MATESQQRKVRPYYPKGYVGDGTDLLRALGCGVIILSLVVLLVAMAATGVNIFA